MCITFRYLLFTACFLFSTSPDGDSAEREGFDHRDSRRHSVTGESSSSSGGGIVGGGCGAGGAGGSGGGSANGKRSSALEPSSSSPLTGSKGWACEGEFNPFKRRDEKEVRARVCVELYVRLVCFCFYFFCGGREFLVC